MSDTDPRPETQTPLRMGRAGALRANREGGEAFRAGKSVTACPYEGSDEDVVADFYQHHWVKGYAIAARVSEQGGS